MPQSYYKKPTFAIPRTIFRGAANNRKGYPHGKVRERTGRMSAYALPQKVSIFKIGMIHFTGRTAATTVMPLLSMALYLGQFVSPLVVSPLAEWWFPDMPQGPFAVGCLLSLLLLLQVVSTRRFQSLPPVKKAE